MSWGEAERGLTAEQTGERGTIARHEEASAVVGLCACVGPVACKGKGLQRACLLGRPGSGGQKAWRTRAVAALYARDEEWVTGLGIGIFFYSENLDFGREGRGGWE